ncbi:MAG: type III-B CRISPR module RAMP protein Cmr1 [Bacteroidota bacterium]
MSEPTRHRSYDLTLKVVTPLFLGGASPTESAELRPPSIKGAMRFWHRATGPGALDSEPMVFGSSSGRLHGQALFLLQIQSPLTSTTKPPPKWDPAIKYMGYGLFETKKSLPRAYIPEGTDIRLRLVFRPGTSDEGVQEVFRSIRLMNYFGGLGSRSRRGFGSVAIDKDMPNDLDDLEKRIGDEFDSLEMAAYDQVEYTMFSNRSRVLLLPGDRTWQNTLLKVARPMTTLRNPAGGRSQGYRWSSNDAHLIGRYARTGMVGQAPVRSAFGLPHNYFFKDTGTTVNVGNNIRKASPLFIHIHRLSNGQHAAVVSYLPAPVVPPGKKIRISTGGKPSRDVSPPDDFSAVIDFLDYLVQVGGAREVELDHGKTK